MAKKSQRRPVRYEKDKSGCMWGFISMFDFRHSHNTRKMIADKRRSSKHAIGVVHSKNKFEMLSNVDEVCQGSSDGGESKRPTVATAANKPSVKKLIEEEMFIDQNAMKDTDSAQIESKESRLRREVLLKLDSKRKNKSYKKNRDKDTNDLNLDTTLKSEITHNPHSRKQSKDNLDLDKMIEEFCHLKDACSMMHGSDGEVEVDAQSNQKQPISENARDAICEFVNQMILNGKDPAEARKFLCSHQLMEALQPMSSDKELFLSLLQNPNSLLLKCVQEFKKSRGTNQKEYSCVTSSNFSEQDHCSLEQNREIVNHKKHNFFRKKAKSQSKSSTNENGNTNLSSTIVILKPGQIGLQNSETGNNLASSQDSYDSVKYNGPSVRSSSHFSLTEIKNKLKHAMGRERHGNPPEGISKRHPVADCQNKWPSSKAFGKDNVGMRSPNKDHFFIEKIARPTTGVMKGDKTGTTKDSELIVEHENGTYPKQRVSNLYIEAKKHLCEIVGNGDENIDSSSRQISRTLGKILSLPEYNFSPLGSPGRDWEHHFVTAQRRFSTSDKIWEANKDNVSSKQGTFAGDVDQEMDNSEKQPSICDESSTNKVEEIKSDSNFADDLNHADEAQNFCPVRDEIVTEGDVESLKEVNVLESSSEPVDLSAGKEDQNYGISETSDSARCSQSSKQAVKEENKPTSPLSSPSHSSTTKKIEELESATEVSGRPSPVSVLDTAFLEDDVNPGYSRFQPVEAPVRPLQFEEQYSSPLNQINREKYCFGENELIYDYIKALLQASGLTIDQLLMKCISSDKILDPSLIDQVEFLPNQLCHDQKLIYDCINEVLVEVCRNYFGVSPCVSFVNPGIRPTPNMKKVIVKVWEGVCWHFLPLPPLRTLDKIVKKDMGKYGAWMDLRLEAETIGFEMGEAILAELMEDTILSCVSNCPESECSQLQFEYKDNENSKNV
ncbi:TRM32 protein [Spatholobus suberectus]|nr:TRM32 protein [Spatholobus suberectus]